MGTLDRIAEDLRSDGDLAAVAAGGLVIRSRRREPLDPPVRLVTTEEELRAHLAGMAWDAADVFPGVAPLQAAYQLFLVHLDEELATRTVPGSEMRLAGGGLRTSPTRAPEDLGLAPGDGPFELLAPEQYRRRFDAAARALVAAPAGRVFCGWLVGLHGGELARAAGLPEAGRRVDDEIAPGEAAEAAVGRAVIDAVLGVDVARLLGGFSDLELIRKLGEVADGLGFGSFEHWHRLRQLPTPVWDPLLPVAQVLVESRAVSWWGSRLLRSGQVAISDDGPPPVGPVPRAALEPEAVDLRPVDQSARSGRWWVRPGHPTILGTTRVVPGTDVPLALVCHEDRAFVDSRVGVWSYRFRDDAPVFEVSGPEDWVALVSRHPRRVDAARRPDWRRWTGWNGDWVVPEWTSVAQEWAGVHVGVAGWLRTAHRPIEVPGGCAVLAGWNPDETVWLRAAPEPVAALGEFDVPEG